LNVSGFFTSPWLHEMIFSGLARPMRRLWIVLFMGFLEVPKDLIPLSCATALVRVNYPTFTDPPFRPTSA